MNTTELFNALRTLNGSLSQIQVDTVNAILESCTKHNVTDEHQIAYIIATSYHEARLKPIRENGLGAGHPYGQKLKMAKDANGNHIPYETPNQIYYGRGAVCQITWYENYQQFSDILSIDLMNNPDLALQTDYACEIGVLGMKGSLFTGVGLSKYFTPTSQDPVNARKIVNGLDQAELIAGYYTKILAGITS